MYMSGMKGRGILTLHLYQDALWNIGPRSEVPYEKEQQELVITDQEKDVAQASNDMSTLTVNEESASSG
jgi:hypothetical protein